MEISQSQKENIIVKVENILRSHFNGPKSEVKVFRDRMNFACPYCGDSTNIYKKRANIYWKNLMYHCYNDGCPKKHTNLVHFLKDNNQSISNKEDLIHFLDYIRENQVVVPTKDYLQYNTFQSLQDYAIPVEVIKSKLNLKSSSENPRIDRYLKSRFMHKRLEYFLYDPLEEQLYIFNFTQDKKSVIGWQIRNFKRGREKYISYTIEKINQIILDRQIDKEDEEIVKMNTLSLYFNIMLVDFSRSVTVFEGPIDSLLIPNSIATSGADKPTDMFDEIPTIRYLFDSDTAGKRVMEAKLKKKKSVFMWNKLVRDYRIREKIKDFNDLISYCWKNQNPAAKDFEQYFTNNPLDIRAV
jgi:hypothetical protein